MFILNLKSKRKKNMNTFTVADNTNTIIGISNTTTFLIKLLKKLSILYGIGSIAITGKKSITTYLESN